MTLRGELLSEPGASLSTVIKVSGKARTPLVIGGPNADAIVYRNGTQTPITNNYVGVGASSFDVREPGKFKKGDRVEIQRIISEKWIAAEEMDGLRRDGENQTWIAPGEVYAQRRKITAISNHTIQIDFPLTDPLNAQLNASGTLIAYDLPDNYTHSCSIESIDIELEDDQTGAPINADDNFPQAVSFSRWSRDNWIRQLSISGFVSAVHVEKDASRITMQDVNVWRELKTNSSAGYPADFLIDGTQTLLHRCSTAGVESSESFTVATGAMVAGPNVALEHATSSDRHMIEPHARWATGVLVDDSLIGSLSLVNRGSYGSGHGWCVLCFHPLRG